MLSCDNSYPFWCEIPPGPYMPTLPEPYVSPTIPENTHCPSNIFSAETAFGQERIIGGEPVMQNSWPWMVKIINKRNQESHQHFCGGTILNSEWILTGFLAFKCF